MKSKHWIVMASSVVLLSGCDVPIGDFCDVSEPIYFGNEGVVDWLAENDESLLRGVVSHNEKTAKCP